MLTLHRRVKIWEVNNMLITKGLGVKKSDLNGAIAGLSVNIYMYAAAVNTDLNIADLDLTKIWVSCTDMNGQRISRMNLKELFCIANVNTDYLKLNELVSKDVAVKEEALLNMQITFPSPIKLDKAEFIADVLSGAYSSDLDATNTQLEIIPIPALDYGETLSRIDVLRVENSASQKQINVKSLYRLGVLNSGDSIDDYPVENIFVQNKYQSHQITKYNVIGKNKNAFKANDITFCIYPCVDIQPEDSQVIINFNSSKVISCSVVYFSHTMTKQSILKATEKRMQEKIKVAQTYGFNVKN